MVERDLRNHLLVIAPQAASKLLIGIAVGQPDAK